MKITDINIEGISDYKTLCVDLKRIAELLEFMGEEDDPTWGTFTVFKLRIASAESLITAIKKHVKKYEKELLEAEEISNGK